MNASCRNDVLAFSQFINNKTDNNTALRIEDVFESEQKTQTTLLFDSNPMSAAMEHIILVTRVMRSFMMIRPFGKNTRTAPFSISFY